MIKDLMNYLVTILFSLLMIVSPLSGQMVFNGDMELGQTGLNTLPSGWNIVSGTPDYCDSSPATCQTLPYKIQNPSPQGVRWVRFFNGVLIPGPNNEVFGQTLTSPLIADQEYTISFYAAYSKINDDVNATTASIILGFSDGMPAAEVGMNNRDTLPLSVPEEWVQHSFTFIPSSDYNYVTFGKLEVDLFNACYIDDVKIIPVCQVDLGPDTTLCVGDTYTLDVETKNGVYLWQNGSTSPTFNVTQPGTYWVEVSANLCTSRDTVVIDFVPGPQLDIDPEVNVCVGDQYQIDVTYPGSSYLWQDGSTAPVYEVTNEGYYEVTVTLGNCSLTKGVEVIYNDPPVVDLGPDTSLCDSYFLYLSPGIDEGAFTWQDGSTTSNYVANGPGTYWVEVERYGCRVADTVVVALRELYCDCFLAFPNVFSPNSDGINDEFEVYNTCPLADFNYSIFNRWGVKIYESDTPGKFWDGTFQGRPAQVGVYTFVVQYQFEDRAQKETRSGSFTLLR